MQADFHAIKTITDSFMLDNNISTSVSEAAEKIPTDEKDYRKCSFVFYFAQPQYTKSRPTYR